VTNSYERLEYLGDAVLDYLISTIIISSESLDVLDPGRITDIRYLPVLRIRIRDPVPF
jgi:dsRNA-specific ribonuclease